MNMTRLIANSALSRTRTRDLFACPCAFLDSRTPMPRSRCIFLRTRAVPTAALSRKTERAGAMWPKFASTR